MDLENPYCFMQGFVLYCLNLRSFFNRPAMSKKLINTLIILQSMRSVFHLFLFASTPSRKIIKKDIERWLEITQDETDIEIPTWKGLTLLLWRFPEYRNLFQYRIKHERGIMRRILLVLAGWLFPPMNTLFIDVADLGEGLFIQHGFSTIIAANSIGKNCWINQQVTIGYADDGLLPTLGDNVQITAGAKVFGKITIGDNVIVGANSVVFKDVPSNCTVVGVPGHIVKRDGKKVKEPL